MGSGRTTNATYASVAMDAKRGTKAFAYSTQVEAHGGRVAELLDPRNPKIRESAFPDSSFLGVVLDNTGSMKKTPAEVREQLPQLVSLMTQGGYTKQPALWFGVVGDANSDRWPFQLMVNVESDLAVIDPIITSMILEGGGGGTRQESYASVAWFCDNRFQLDEWRRGAKGTLVFVGDEGLYPRVTAGEIRNEFGLPAQGDVSTQEIFASLTQKFDVYLIRPTGGSYVNDQDIEDQWKSLIGLQNVLHIDDTKDIAPMIAGLVGMRNGISLDRMNEDLGESVTMALATLGGDSKAVAPRRSNAGKEVRRFTKR